MKRILFALTTALAASAFAQGWIPTTAGTYDYLDPANWTDGEINGVFGPEVTGYQNIIFGQDHTLGENGLSFGLTGYPRLTFRADGTGLHTLTFTSDQSWTPSVAKEWMAFGSATAGQELNINLGGDRTFYSTTFPIYFYNEISGGNLTLTGTANPWGFRAGGHLADGLTLTASGYGVNLRFGEESDSDTGMKRVDTLRIQGASPWFYARKNGTGATDSIGTLIVEPTPHDQSATSVGGMPTLQFRNNLQKNLALRIGHVSRPHGEHLGLSTTSGIARFGDSIKVFLDDPSGSVGGEIGTTGCAVVPWVLFKETLGNFTTPRLAVYDSENGFRPLDNDMEVQTIDENFDGILGTTGENIAIDTSATLVEFRGDRTVVNSLKTPYASAATTITATNGILEVTSGALVLESNQKVTLDANIDFGSRHGYIMHRNGKTANLKGSIAGTDGLTVAGLIGQAGLTGGSFEINSSATFEGDLTISGAANVQIHDPNFFPHGSRNGKLIVDASLRVGNAQLFTVNGLLGEGAIGLINNYTSTLAIGDNDSDGDFNGRFYRNSGNLSISKIGTGTQRFGGDININQAINVNAGTAIFDGNVSAGAFNVAAGAAIGGTGTIAPAVNFADGAKLKVGVDGKAVKGALTVSSIVAAADATITVDVESDGWKSDACILKVTGNDATLRGLAFAKGANCGNLSLSQDGTELWMLAKRGLTIVIR